MFLLEGCVNGFFAVVNRTHDFEAVVGGGRLVADSVRGGGAATAGNIRR